MPTKIKSRKGQGKTAIKTRRGKPRLKRGVDVEEGASGRKSDMKKPRRDPTEADALWSMGTNGQYRDELYGRSTRRHQRNSMR